MLEKPRLVQALGILLFAKWKFESSRKLLIFIYEIGMISKVNGSKGKAWRHSLQVSQMHRWSGMQGQELTLTINL